MAIRIVKPGSNGQRHLSYLETKTLSKSKSPRNLITSLKKNAGRNNSGSVSVRHQGGGSKRQYRIIDFRRDKIDIPAKVAGIEYDPNRTANIALLIYKDGEKRYILAPEGLKAGDVVVSSAKADFKTGNCLPLEKIPLGMPIHNVELRNGKGGQIVKSAGSSAIIQSKEGKYANMLLPSGEVRKILLDCHATIGQLSNADWKNVTLGKAGRRRHQGVRPSVRGVAMSPNSHPHGGGEGRTGIGMPGPKTYKGKSAVGKTRSKRKYSTKLIIKRRK